MALAQFSIPEKWSDVGWDEIACTINDVWMDYCPVEGVEQ